MREIKFRAWDKDNDQMIYDFGLTPEYIPYQIPQGDESDDPANYSYYDDAELMQYTGLKDKNGTDVYEGDILGFDKWKGEYYAIAPVVYERGCFEVYIKRIAESHNLQLGTLSLLAESEVIGNIYENPELLK